MSALMAEFIGTAILLLLGNGVVANVALKGTKGNEGGWMVVTLAWGLAVFTGVFITADISGAHLNPAVTIGLASAGEFAWSLVGPYIAMQMLGAAVGTTLVFLMYKPHYDITDSQADKLATFATGTDVRSLVPNVLSEVLGTFVLVYGVLHIAGASVGGEPASLGAIDALPVALVVVVVGLGLGGTTGYAINPARDLAPRIMHALLPVPDKGGSDWGYAWIPVVGPILGGVLAAVVKIYVG